MDNILTGFGYRVIVAVDGLDAVEKFKDNADIIDLIIMDMILPNKNGKTACEGIWPIKPNVRVLFYSGYSANIIQQLGDLGEDAEFISKPVHPSELMNKVREMLER